MKSKQGLSKGTKKVLLGTGIVFGTVLVYLISFFLSFSLIINPINISLFGSGETETENQALQEDGTQTEESGSTTNDNSVESARDRAEIIPEPEPDPEEPETGETSTEGTTTSQQDTQSSTQQGATDGKEMDDDFDPSTVTTPEGGYAPEVEPEIPVIEIP